MKPLSQRLSLLLSFAEEGKNICDVGTDHGYLSAALSLSGKYGKITATDINEKPLMNARKNLEKLGVKNVKLVLCDGLSGVSGSEADNVIIAGMGGEVIWGIIERTPFLKDERVKLILQPTTAASFLREKLYKNGFYAEKEEAVTENGKIYSVMAVRYDGEERMISPTQKRIGILGPTTPQNISYIEKQYNIVNKKALDLKNIEGKEEEYNEALGIASQIKKILEARNGA